MVARVVRYALGTDARGIAPVYVPAHFKPDDAEVGELLAHPGAADLVTSTPRGLLATLLPFVHDAAGSRPDVGAWGALLGHVARDNEQWREPAQGEALVIVRGPDAYVSPTWYAAKQEHGRVVPTWNYITAHVYGRLVVHDDARWVEALVRRLTDRHEAEREKPWSVDDAPPPYLAGQLRAIVGVEMLIDRVEGKFKLSQNRSEADVDGVIAGLDASGQPGLADAMRNAQRLSVPSRGPRRQAP
jgi:transcriptional regulator